VITGEVLRGRTRCVRRTAFLVIPASLITLAGCGGDNGDRGETSNPKLAVDERNGTVEGVGLGDRDARIEQVFGKAPRYSIYEDSTPIGVDPPDLTLAAEGGCKPQGRENALRYRGVSFDSYDGIACDVTVTSEGGATRRGLQPGDPISRADELYPKLECGETNVSSDSTAFEPACWGKLGKATYMWVGGDPIDNLSFVDRPIGPRL
jgi:hypothetical protein